MDFRKRISNRLFLNPRKKEEDLKFEKLSQNEDFDTMPKPNIPNVSSARNIQNRLSKMIHGPSSKIKPPTEKESAIEKKNTLNETTTAAVNLHIPPVPTKRRNLFRFSRAYNHHQQDISGKPEKCLNNPEETSSVALPENRPDNLAHEQEIYVECESILEYDSHPEKKDDVLIISFGEGFVKSGLVNENQPSAVFPTICGQPQSFNVRVMADGVESDQVYMKFGDEAASKRGVYALEWFNDTENGKPKYHLVGDMLIYNSSHVLRRQLKNDAVIFPVNVDTDIDRRTKLVCLAFEKIGARAVCICEEEKVALQFVTQVEHPTGIVIDIGHSKTRCVAYMDGERADLSIQRTMACGKTMTARMFSLLKDRTSIFEQTITGLEFAREAKEKHAFVSLELDDAEEESNSSRYEEDFLLKDGNSIIVGKERYLCAEVLFHPERDEGKLSYLKAKSLQECIIECLRTYDRCFWNDLVQNIVVCGGGARLPNLKDRLEMELFKLVPLAIAANMKITIDPNAGWSGACEFVRKPSRKHWIDRKEWKSGGEAIVRDRLAHIIP